MGNTADNLLHQRMVEIFGPKGLNCLNVAQRMHVHAASQCGLPFAITETPAYSGRLVVQVYPPKTAEILPYAKLADDECPGCGHFIDEGCKCGGLDI